MPLVSLRPSGGRRNSTGLLLALAFALIGAGVVLFVFISGRSSTPGPPGGVPADRVNFGQLPENVGEATDIAAVGRTSNASFQVADKNDPTRVAMELVFARLDPLGSGVYQATEPKAWAYLKDGRTIFVRADTGRIRRSPTAAAPESGEFSGNGVVLVFPPRPDGDTRPIDPLNDTPGLIGHFTTASFDTVLLEISSEDPWTVESESMWAAGTGFVVRANQVRERLEFAKINSGGEIRYARKTEPAAAPAPADTTFMGPPAPPAAAPAPDSALADDDADEPPRPDREPAYAMGPPLPPREHKEDLYLAEFRDGVTLVQAGRTLAADLLSTWVRFLDDKLPDDALGFPQALSQASGVDAGSPPTTRPLPILPVRAQVAALALAQAPAKRSLFSPSPDDIVLTWTGGMVARPLSTDEPPAELASGNHLHVRFTAERAGGASRVLLTDRDTGAVGVCSALDYAATLRQLTLARGPSSDRVDVSVPGAGRFVVPTVTVNLATGLAAVTGGGVLLYQPDEYRGRVVTVNPEFPRPADPDAPLPEGLTRQIAWSDRAQFRFRARDGQITDALRSAAFTGQVVARDRASWLSGDELRASFIERPEKKTSLSRLRVTGNALGVGRSARPDPDAAWPSQDPFIAAAELDVRFAPSVIDPDEEDATSVAAAGDVRLGDARGRIAAQRLEARLHRVSASDYEAGEVRASGEAGGVQIDLANREGGGGGGGVITARADELHADGQKRWADLIGQSVTLAKGASLIFGQQMRLEEIDGRLEVFGPGSMRHVQVDDHASDAALVLPPSALDAPTSADLPPGVTVMRAAWTRSMSFNDRTGRIECHGDSTVTATSLDGGQVSRSERLLLDITPAGEAAPGAAGGVTLGSALQEGGGGEQRLDGRRLLRAESLGSVLEVEGGVPASVKSWKFAPPAEASPGAPREHQQVLYMEGPRIIADERVGTVTIPDAGRALSFDRGDDRAARPEGALGGGAAGRSQFTWAGSMEFNRLTGVLRMLRDVEARHLPLDSTELLRMTCADLTAVFNTASGSGGELVSAEAVGGVYAESGPRYLTADTLSYDAPTSTAVARSQSDSPVTMMDQRQPAPLLARSLRWELRTDRVEVTEPMPVTGGLTR